MSQQQQAQQGTNGSGAPASHSPQIKRIGSGSLPPSPAGSGPLLHHASMPQLDISGLTLGSSPSLTNGNGTPHEYHPLSRSDSMNTMNTPPKKMSISGKDHRRIFGISVSPGSEYTAGPLSPTPLGASPVGAVLLRSGSSGEFSPRDKMGISPRTKPAPSGSSAPIPIAGGAGHHHFSSPLASPSPSSSPSHAYPLMKIEMTAKDGTSKANWTAEAIKKHPEILQIMERVRPVSRAAAFGRTYTVAKTVSKDEFLVGRENMVQLILQHLHYEGLKGSRRVLEEESGIKYVDPQLTESRLLNLIRLAIKDTERVWELTLSTSAEAGHLLEELLADMSLLQDDPSQDADDVNIWSEPEDGNILFAEEKEAAPATTGDGSGGALGGLAPLSPGKHREEKVRPIKAASLNQLIVMLAREEKHDIEYMKTFLLTYQSFTTPSKLLQKLIQRYHVPQKPGMSDDEYKKMALVIQLRVVAVLKAWIKDRWSDFNDKLLAALRLFIEGTLRIQNKNFADMIAMQLNMKRPGEEEEKKTKQFHQDPPEPIVPRNIFSLSLDLFDVDEIEIARQITLIDFEIYSSIKLSELLNQSWNKPKLRHRSPNVIRMINRFNEMSQWVATSILRQEKIKDRTRTMAKFIKIADYLLKPLNNFNTTMAILAGLNGAAVHRLKYTREEVPRHIQQQYTDMQHALDSNQSYKSYRSLIANSNPPCIPYLGVYLTDLTFIEDGNPDFIVLNGRKLINFTKRKYIYDVIAKVERYQFTPYNLQPVYQIASLLQSPVREHMDEDKQFKISLLREPRSVDRSEIL